MEVVKQPRNQERKNFPSLSVISKSLHSTFMLCTALALLSVSMQDTMLAFLLIPESTNYSI